MFNNLKLIPLLLLAPIIYYLVEKNISPNEGAASSLLNKNAPTFSDGNFELSNLKGKPIVLHFWATWCGPCIVELPNLVEFAKKHSKDGVQVVAISEDRDMAIVDQFINSREKIKDIRKYVKIILDPQGKIAKLYETNQFPETFLINSHFVVDNKLVGEQDWTSEGMSRYLDKLK